MDQNLVGNGGFETGSLSPWFGSGASITAVNPHSGFFAASLAGGTNAYIYQTFPVTPGEKIAIFLSLAKTSVGVSPPVVISLYFLDASSTFLGYGLIVNLQAGSLPDASTGNWKSIYGFTTPVPENSANAFLIINGIAQTGTVSFLIDDVVASTGGGDQVANIAFPITAEKLRTLIGNNVTLYTGILTATGTVTEVTDEYVRIVDTNGVSDLFPLVTLSVVEYT